MGFMDKAKKLAEQAQAKFDDVQTQFNERQQQETATVGSDPAAQPQTAPPAPHGDPLADAATEQPHADGKLSDPPRPHGDPVVAPPDEAAPGFTSGDPLAG